MGIPSVTPDSLTNILVRLSPPEQISLITVGLESDQLRPIMLKVLQEDQKLIAQFSPNIKVFYEREVGRITKEDKEKESKIYRFYRWLTTKESKAEKGSKLLSLFSYCITHNFQSFARTRSNRSLSPIEPLQVPRRSDKVTPIVQWTYNDADLITLPTPAEGKDGTVYLGGLVINSNGTPKKAEFEPEGAEVSSSTIDRDGNVYLGSQNGKLYSTNPDGAIRWEFSTGAGIASSPAVGEEGTIYVGSLDRFFYAINPDGTLKWRVETKGPIFSSPCVDAEGIVYVGSDDHFLYAINPDGSEKWKFNMQRQVKSSPIVGRDGTVYASSLDYLYAINPDGKEKWKNEPISTRKGNGLMSPAIGIDGIVYVQSKSSLRAINPENGLDLWESYTKYSQTGQSPEIGDNGTIYVVDEGGFVYAFEPKLGHLLWQYSTDAPYTMSSPSVGADGMVYVLAGQTLYAIKEVPAT